MRKNWKKLLGLVVVSVFILAACGGGNGASDAEGETDTADDEDVETLTAWTFPGMGLKNRLETEGEKLGLNVEVQEIEFEQITTSIDTALASGDEDSIPDIIGLGHEHFARYRDESSNYFVDLSEYDSEGFIDEFLDWKVDSSLTEDGSVVGIGTDIVPYAVGYNINIFEEAGLPTEREEVDELIEDWDDFEQVGLTIKEETGKFLLDDPRVFLNLMLSENAYTFYDEDGELYLDNPAIKEAWDNMVSLIDNDLVFGSDQMSGDSTTGISNEDFATLQVPSWMFGWFEDTVPEVAGNWDLITTPGGGTTDTGSWLMVTESSSNPEKAYELITNTTGKEGQIEQFQEQGQYPSNELALEDPEVQDATNEFFNDAPIGEIYGEIALNSTPPYTTGNYSSILNSFQNGIEQYMETGEDPDLIFEQVVQQAEQQENR